MLASPVMVGIKFDHLVKVVTTRFLHCTATIFPFVLKKYFCGEIFGSYLVFIRITLTRFSLHR